MMLLQRLFLFLFLLGLFTACTNEGNDKVSLLATSISDERTATITPQLPTLTPTSSPTETPLPTAIQTNTPTNTPSNTPKPTITPTLAPTAPIWVAANTPMATAGRVITVNNVAQLAELARWGRGVITDLDLSVDGQWLAVAAGSGVYIHDVNQLSAPALAIEAEANVKAVSIAPAGQKVALVTQNGSLAIWQVNPAQQLYMTNGEATEAHFSPNGLLLLVAGNGGVDLLGVETGDVINHYAGMQNGIFSPDSTEVIVWDYESAKRFDWQNNQLLSEVSPINHLDAPEHLEGVGLIITDLVFHERDLIFLAPQVNSVELMGPVEIQRAQDNSLLFSVTDRFRLSNAVKYVCNEPVVYWDPPEPAGPWQIEISPDGSIAGLLYQDAGFSDDYQNHNNLRFYRMADGQLLYNVMGGVVDFAILPDGERWITGLQDGQLQIRDLNTNVVLETVAGYESPLFKLEVSADNQWIGAAYLDKVKIYRREDGQIVHHYPAGAIAFAPDSHSFALGYPDGRIELRDLISGELLKVAINHTDKITALEYLPSGELLSAGFDCQLIIWQLPEMTRINSLENVMVEGQVSEEPVPFRVRDFRIMPDGQTIIGSLLGGEFGVWTLPNGLLLREPEWEHGISVLDLSPNGRYLAIGGSSGFELWDENLIIRRLDADTAGFSPDGALIAGSEWGWMENRSLMGALQIWQTAPMTMLWTMKPETDSMLAVVFTPDGQFIISSGLDGVIRLWGIAE